MKLVRKFSVVKALFVTVFGLALSAGPAQAQSLSGKFTLPTEVHWKTVVMPAGNYEFSLQGSGAGSMLVVRSIDTGHSAMLMPVSVSEASASGSDSLQLTRQGGATFVTSFEMGSLGLIFHYPVPSGAAEVASRMPQPTMTVGK
jgi:hypothetical protein